MRTMLKSKVHRVQVTEANLNYEGSITLDTELMEAADILPYEMVHILDVNNGTRLETYAIPGEATSGQVCINGAAARLIQPGDTVIILTYAPIPEEEAQAHHPRLVHVDAQNRVIQVKIAH